jgi:peptidoglycan hydrolase-like protein with peptidoglycan-binding domain
MGKIFRGAAALAAGLAVAVSSTMGTGVAANADTGTGPAAACSVTYAKYSSIKAGSTGDQATAMECLLAAAGFSTTVNGSFSTDDAAQLAKFRTSVGLSPLTVGGARAWSALLSHGTAPALKSGDKGDDVVRLQLSLRAAGFTVPDAGSFDAATVKVVKAAQKSRHLTQTGTANAALWKALQAGKVKAAAAAKPKPKPAKKSKGARALAYAKRQLGERYRYGAAGPNAWDCSGLTMKAWASVGVKLPHNARSQFHRGKKVSRSHLRKGDLVFFYSGISHVGIYAGKGKIIHASRPGHPVAYIKIKYMPYKGARRP